MLFPKANTFFPTICFLSFNVILTSAFFHTDSPKPIAKSVDLRILPLGDSITWGEGSTDENGYRLALSNLITTAGNKLTYIGSVKSGTMANNENEGHGGFQITQVGMTGKVDYPERPNVVLFMAGTNDVVFDVDLGNAPARLRDVIGEIVTACPNAAVLVGTLTPLVNPRWMSKITELNSKIPDVVSGFAVNGEQVALVDMSRVNISHIHTSDGIHPTDEAYALIAAAWYEGIVEAGKKRWIRKPLPRASQNGSEEMSEEQGVSSGRGDGSKFSDGLTLGGSSWTLGQGFLFIVLLLGVFITVRKVAGIVVRNYKR